jgi:hypothetical protein
MDEVNGLGDVGRGSGGYILATSMRRALQEY